ncbi:GntR family transcriptional regulator [Streptomyces sp. IBSBF 2435]|uniref:GntR family transcriptional regulator n=1 Tax=Streptomyces sp. IBSBF 2435 TaxID=2903531 RepID=UPI002FDB99E5
MTLSSDDPRAPYVQVADVLRLEIERGTHGPGKKLPSVRELSERFGVAPMTISNALRVLRDGGYVASTPGRGTFVREAQQEATPAAPTVADLADRVTALDTTVRELTERLERLEANG